MEFRVAGEIIEWRGPAPHLFVVMSAADSTTLREQPELSYGWGCIPATVTVGGTRFTTALMPRQGRYLVPLKVRVRRAEDLDLGDVIELTVHVADDDLR
ncbi:MAG: DUF1905 domain-containing protein [Tetrasphaera sp.]